MHTSDDRECLQRLRTMIQRGLKRHKTYRKLAAEVNVSPSMLQRIAKGKTTPTVLLVHRIAYALGETFPVGRDE